MWRESRREEAGRGDDGVKQTPNYGVAVLTEVSVGAVAYAAKRLCGVEP